MYKILLYFLILLPLNTDACKLKTVRLSDYGSIKGKDLEKTISRAIDEIDGKCLLLPSLPLDVNDIIIERKKNFVIVGDATSSITCKNFKIEDCCNFELKGLFVKGTKERFTTFYIKGDCSEFRIHDCLFDSEKAKDGHNTFYGIHIIADYQGKRPNFSNSPRNFRIDHNIVRNTRYDGILAHAYCSDFVIEKNIVIGAECMGIEVEGRLGSNTQTLVNPCRNSIVRNNQIENSGGWGILLMWTDNVKVYGNISKHAGGSFLSIGCKNLIVKRNLFDGYRQGFEISQEFYKVENGINENVRILNNVIIGRSRAEGRGVLDIRHARNVLVRNNRIVSLYRDKTAYVSLGSCQQVTIKNNQFSFEGEPLKDLLYKSNVPCPGTGRSVPELDIKDLNIQKIRIRKVKIWQKRN